MVTTRQNLAVREGAENESDKIFPKGGIASEGEIMIAQIRPKKIVTGTWAASTNNSGGLVRGKKFTVRGNRTRITSRVGPIPRIGGVESLKTSGGIVRGGGGRPIDRSTHGLRKIACVKETRGLGQNLLTRRRGASTSSSAKSIGERPRGYNGVEKVLPAEGDELLSASLDHGRARAGGLHVSGSPQKEAWEEMDKIKKAGRSIRIWWNNREERNKNAMGLAIGRFSSWGNV